MKATGDDLFRTT